jgi:hypothetical protein
LAGVSLGGGSEAGAFGLARDFGFNPMRAFNRCMSGAAWAAQDDWAVAVEDDGETAGAKDLQTPRFGSKDNGATGEEDDKATGTEHADAVPAYDDEVSCRACRFLAGASLCGSLACASGRSGGCGCDFGALALCGVS